MRAAIYIRVSTEEQALEGYSISAQRQRLKAYCIAQDWTIAGFYVDEGLSAKDTKRPQLQKMISDVKEGKVDCVLVYRLDRLTRSVLDLYQLLQVFDKYECKFKSATEVYDTTTAIGRLFITLVAALAQWERENTAERVRFGMQEKARQGKWAASTAPFGYDRDGDDLIINEKEANIVRKAFDMYINQHLGMHKIALSLNKSGFLTKKGSEWNSSTMRYLLRNPIYTGTMRWNYRVNQENYFEVEGAVPAIIDAEVYERANSIMEKRTTNHPRSATSEFIFSGTAKCSRCGSPLAGKYGYSRRGDKVYRPRSYYCTSQLKGSCNLPNISERYIEHHFLDLIGKWDIKQDDFEIEEDNNNEDVFKLKLSLEKELEAIEKRRKKWQYAWANEMINDKQFNKRMEEEDEKEEPIKTQLQNLPDIETNNKETDKTMILEMLQDFHKNWKWLEPLEKKSFITTFVKVLKVDKTGPGGKVENVKITDLKFY